MAQALNPDEDDDHNDAKSRWQRGVFIAGRLQDGNALMTTEQHVTANQAKDEPEFTKSLEKQHWLELVDPLVLLKYGCRDTLTNYFRKHRYGANCQTYSFYPD